MDSDVAELSLKDYVEIVKRRRLIVVVIVAIAVGIAVIYSLSQTPVYEAEAQMLVDIRDSDSIYNTGTDLRGSDATRQLQTEIQILEGERVRSLVAERLGLSDDPPPVVASIIGSTDVLAVRVRSTNRAEAATLANEYVAAYIDNRREAATNDLSVAIEEIETQIDSISARIDELGTGDPNKQKLVDQRAAFEQTASQLRVDAALKTGGASLVQTARPPETPVEPRPARTAVLAGLLGLMLGLGVAFGLDYFDDTIHSEDDLEHASGLPVLAAVPSATAKDVLPISVSQPDQPASEAYRGLRTNVRFLSIDRDVTSIVVTSALISEGKSTTAANLAVVLAQAGRTVALVDADLRRPRVHKFFDTSVSPGLVDWMVEDNSHGARRTVILPTGESLELVPAGKPPHNPGELLIGNRIQAVIDELSATYDTVIFDAAPVLPVSDTLALAGRVDGVLLVVDALQARKTNVGEAIERLTRVGANLIGIVMNNAKVTSSSYKYNGNYGTAYGARVDAPARGQSKRRQRNGSDPVAGDYSHHVTNDTATQRTNGPVGALASRRQARETAEDDFWR